MDLNKEVQTYWEKTPCGTKENVVGSLKKYTKEWFEQVENHRYETEPCIHSFVQFTRHHGKIILEIGIGAGSDHIQWARAGAKCYGVDLTEAGIELTKKRFDLYGLHSTLTQFDAETLPFEDNFFDVVYSWGVIHHSENPQKIIDEIYRVLKPNGMFIGMLYHRFSLVVLKLWIKYALLKLQPWRSFSNVVWRHMESIGTKAYTIKEIKKLFIKFTEKKIQPIITFYDISKFPSFISKFFPDSWGWFLGIKCKKGSK